MPSRPLRGTIFSKRRALARKRRSGSALRFEPLEPRLAKTALPFGALPEDTAEFLLGDVHVTVVLMESNDQISINNNNSETWTPQSIANVKAKVEEGLQWWVDTLAVVTDKHELTFHIDFTHADNPVSTPYEPITRPSTDFQFWIYDFLRGQVNTTGTFTTDVRNFNHEQRVAHAANWAFTIFVVNDENDFDHRFAPGGLDRAFAFPGGLFLVTLASRPASTITHETGHIFWALDEYQFGGTAAQSRGYYDTPNSNAWNSGLPRQPSIMDRGPCEEGGGLLCDAWQQHTSSDSSLAMLGWQDSDGDGVFDVLDVPHTLTGTGSYNPANGTYRFRGESAVQTLANKNPRGEQPQATESRQSDITISKITRAQYRIDGGAWQTAATYDTYEAELDLSFPVPSSATLVEIRTIDDVTGVTSPVFQGTLSGHAATDLPGINGFIFGDADRDGAFDLQESGVSGQTVRLVDSNGQPITLAASLEPDNYAPNAAIGSVLTGVTLTATGSAAADETVYARSVGQGATGSRVFAACSFVQGNDCGIYATEWTTETRHLRMDFATPVTAVSLDAVGQGDPDYGRLEIYDANDNLLGRYTTGKLSPGQVEKMSLARPTAEIAYAVARGYADTSPRFDNLRFGPEALAVTDSSGAYSIPYVLPGDYIVQVVPTSGSTPTMGFSQNVSVASGAAVAGVNFGLENSTSAWQNQASPNDVNGDGFVSPLDALLIVNDLNADGSRKLAAGDAAPPFLDVNGDGFVSPIDVLRVVNAIEDANSGEGESNPVNAALANRMQLPAAGSTERHDSLATEHSSIRGSEGEGSASRRRSPHERLPVEGMTPLLENHGATGLAIHEGEFVEDDLFSSLIIGPTIDSFVEDVASAKEPAC